MRYSQQLSAPYVQPPSCEINLARSRVFPDSLHLPGAISNLLKGSTERAPPAETAPVSEPIETEPVKEESVSETVEPVLESVEPVLESAEPVIEAAEVTDEVPKEESIVDAVIDEIKSDLNKAATEVE